MLKTTIIYHLISIIWIITSTFCGIIFVPESTNEETAKRNNVFLYIYDLNIHLKEDLLQYFPNGLNGLVRHSSIVVYGKEYMYGADGIKTKLPTSNNTSIFLGSTNLEERQLDDYLRDQNGAGGNFEPAKYDFYFNNSHTFSRRLAEFLQVHFQNIPNNLEELPTELKPFSNLPLQVVNLIGRFFPPELPYAVANGH